MTGNITPTIGMAGFLQSLNFEMPHHAAKRGEKFESTVSDKLISIQRPDGTHLGKNIDDNLSTGTMAEVRAGTADIENEVANLFINLGFFKEVI